MTAMSASSALVPAGRQALVPGFSANVGNLDAYISTVNRLPLLSQEEETSLARRLRNDGDLAAAQALVMSHLRLVVSIARGYLGYGLPHADLIQEGNIGLMKAVKRFDPEQGVRLVSYAIHWIKAEIHEFILRNWRMVKLATTKAQRKLFFNLRSHKTSLDAMSPEQVDELAESLNVKREEVIEMEMRMSGRDIALDAPTDEDDDAKFAPIAYEGKGISIRVDKRGEDPRLLGVNATISQNGKSCKVPVTELWTSSPDFKYSDDAKLVEFLNRKCANNFKL